MEFRDARAQYGRWLRFERRLSPHTVRAYEGDALAFERFVGARTEVGDLDCRQVLAFMTAQRASGLAQRSLRRRAAGVRSFCRWLTAGGLVEADPWDGVTVDLRCPKLLPRPLPGHDLSRLIGSLRQAANLGESAPPDGELSHPYAATTLLAVALMVVAGLRVGEVSALRVQDVDGLDDTVRVLGKGAKERSVFLSGNWLTGLMRAYLVTRVAVGVGHQRLLFNARGAPLDAAAIRSRVRLAAHDAGIRRLVTPHMLRHSAATELIEAGVDIRYIQRLLGHSSLTITEIYTHVADQALKRAVSTADVLARVFTRDN